MFSNVLTGFNNLCINVWGRTGMFLAGIFAGPTAFAQNNGFGSVNSGSSSGDVGFLRMFNSLTTQGKGLVAFLIVGAFIVGCFFLYLAWMSFAGLSDEQRRKQEKLGQKFALYGVSGVALVFFALTPLIFGEALFGAEQSTANEIKASEYGF